jgi:hypothetical protein
MRIALFDSLRTTVVDSLQRDSGGFKGPAWEPTREAVNHVAGRANQVKLIQLKSKWTALRKVWSI